MGKIKQFSIGTLLGAAGVLGLKNYLQYRHDLAAAEQRIKTESQFIETKGGRIVYNRCGEGTPVLIIHGAGGGFDQALHVVQHFDGAYQWIAPCRFGYLGSHLPEEASPEAQADAYAALLDSLGIKSLPVIGMSAGGPSSIQFALRYPERCRGLVLIAAVSQAMAAVTVNPDIIETLLDWMLVSDWPIWFGTQLAIHKIRPPLGVPAKVMQQIDPSDEAWLKILLSYELPVQPRRKGIVHDLATILQLDIFPLEQIRTPTLVIHARDDGLVPIHQGRFSAQQIPDARYVELPSGGHLLLGQRKRIKAEVGPFLEKVMADH